MIDPAHPSPEVRAQRDAGGMRAILSVYDKAGIVDFGRALAAAGIELVSTGGTNRALAEAGLSATGVSDLTGFREMMDGRVKTLHPAIHGGILARRNVDSDMDQLAAAKIGTIDLVAVNLYPFAEAVARPDAQLSDALENIDIGGPTMIRAAAKNFPHVLVAVDPDDYGWIAERLANGGPDSISLAERRMLAQKAFTHVSAYDSAIATYLGSDENEELPSVITLSAQRSALLRYGENPHQAGALYVGDGSGGVARAEQLHGGSLSYNNLLDADAAWQVVSDFSGGATVVIKHNNPCGLAVSQDQTAAYKAAFAGDPVSAYGGIVGFNRTVNADTAKAMKGVFYEVIVAPGYDADALEILGTRKKLRILKVEQASGPQLPQTRRITGGMLIQGSDDIAEDPSAWDVVTQRTPTASEMEDLKFAWKAAKFVRSNAIVLARDRALIGMGAGQPNRLNSIHLAIRAAGNRARESVLASDAFFPFADNVEMASEAGVAAIVQPGGSIRDDEVVEMANQLGIAMVFTGVRHFRH